jgi:AcrR family transcriptional regulator
VINEAGYERATMSAIAERANSCIGSLYQFFPNKRALAEAVRAQYGEEIDQSWMALGRQAANLTAEQLACRMVNLQLETVKNHPALLALLDVPPTPRTSKRRELTRAQIAAVLMAHRPEMPRTAALRIAAVAQHVNRALLGLYAKSRPEEKAAVIRELRAVLTGYLVPKLKHSKAASPLSTTQPTPRRMRRGGPLEKQATSL